jgi:peptide/nickel transport system permease protein
MARYIASRLGSMIPVLVIISILVFMMLRLIPGDPVRVMLAESGASAERVEAVRQQLGLNDPLPVQYRRFAQQLLTGEVRSIRTQRPAVQQYFTLFPETLKLALTALVLAAVLGITLGVLAALRQHSWLDTFAMLLSFVGVSVPSFWLSLVLIFVFAQKLAWLPATGGGDFKHLILPAVVLAVQQTALIARLVRAYMVETLQEDYVKTARAKGLRERSVILDHALRNAFIPVLTLLGLNFGYLLSGAVIVETVFARPGTGRLIIDGILSKDFPVVQTAVLLTATIYLLVNLLTDVSYALIDPRIRR